jgi:7,8-dihydropterin-6-yl-methyl-4-(beta-D-ribofuranosyl)aminobenzene 5'-phosphate synthase
MGSALKAQTTRKRMRIPGFVIFLVLCIFVSFINSGENKKNSGGEEKLNLTIIYDNYEHGPGLVTAWGFSCLIQGAEKTVLFDTGGDGRLLLENMKKLNLDPKAVEVIFLSHIHGDHTGGLGEFLTENSDVQVFLPASFPKSFKDGVRGFGAEVIEISGSREIFKNFFSTGEMGSYIREQSLVIKTDKGAVVITGCAHPGIVEIVEKACEITGTGPRLVLGGFHLGGTRDTRILEIIDRLRKLGTKQAGPCHCSGGRTRELFKEEMSEAYLEVGVGKVITLD